MPEFVALKVKETHQDNLLKKPNIIGTGVGKREIDGIEKSAIIVFVEKKLTPDDVISKYSAADLIPEEIEGIPTKIIEVGKVVKQGFQNKVRPLQPGYSIGHGSITAGTLGGFFKDKDGDIVALTNNHVAANENRASIGDVIYQPGPMDSPRGSCNFSGWTQPAENLPCFGTLKRFVPLNRANNLHDSAIIKIHQSYIDSNLINTAYPSINKPMNGIGSASINAAVQKFGRTTGHTTGTVIADHASFTIGYDFGSARFNDCVVLSGMSSGGDSGSIIFDMNMNAIGLLFAGSGKVTLANQIQFAVNEYGLTPYNGMKSQATEDGADWSLKAINGTIAATETSMAVTAKANTSCYVEKRIEKFNNISVKVKTLTDRSENFGPGMAISNGPNFIKICLTSTGVKGSTNSTTSFVPATVDGSQEFIIRFKVIENNILSSVFINNSWIDVSKLPVSDNDPMILKIGKLSNTASDGSDPVEGDLVSCIMSDMKIS